MECKVVGSTPPRNPNPESAWALTTMRVRITTPSTRRILRTNEDPVLGVAAGAGRRVRASYRGIDRSHRPDRNMITPLNRSPNVRLGLCRVISSTRALPMALVDAQYQP